MLRTAVLLEASPIEPQAQCVAFMTRERTLELRLLSHR